MTKPCILDVSCVPQAVQKSLKWEDGNIVQVKAQSCDLKQVASECPVEAINVEE